MAPTEDGDHQRVAVVPQLHRAPDELRAVAVGQPEVDHQHVGHGLLDDRQGGGEGGDRGGEAKIRLPSDRLAVGAQEFRLVFDDQDADGVHVPPREWQRAQCTAKVRDAGDPIIDAMQAYVVVAA